MGSSERERGESGASSSELRTEAWELERRALRVGGRNGGCGVEIEPGEAFTVRVLEALVTGYRAREGVKERFRSLTEYEIARRTGITEYSYVEYGESSERAVVRDALDDLEQRGLVLFVRASGRYDAFAPTDGGNEVIREGSDWQRAAPSLEDQGAASREQDAVVERIPPDVDQKLDEIIRLLRSIERKLDAGLS